MNFSNSFLIRSFYVLFEKMRGAEVILKRLGAEKFIFEEQINMR
jgi:hypothetical protein